MKQNVEGRLNDLQEEIEGIDEILRWALHAIKGLRRQIATESHNAYLQGRKGAEK